MNNETCPMGLVVLFYIIIAIVGIVHYLWGMGY